MKPSPKDGTSTADFCAEMAVRFREFHDQRPDSAGLHEALPALLASYRAESDSSLGGARFDYISLLQGVGKGRRLCGLLYEQTQEEQYDTIAAELSDLFSRLHPERRRQVMLGLYQSFFRQERIPFDRQALSFLHTLSDNQLEQHLCYLLIQQGKAGLRTLSAEIESVRQKNRLEEPYPGRDNAVMMASAAYSLLLESGAGVLPARLVGRESGFVSRFLELMNESPSDPQRLLAVASAGASLMYLFRLDAACSNAMLVALLLKQIILNDMNRMIVWFCVAGGIGYGSTLTTAGRLRAAGMDAALQARQYQLEHLNRVRKAGQTLCEKTESTAHTAGVEPRIHQEEENELLSEDAAPLWEDTLLEEDGEQPASVLIDN